MNRLLHVCVIAAVQVVCCTTESRAHQIPELIKALGDPNVRQGASIALAKLGAAAVPALRVSLTSDLADVRVWSAHTLGEIGPAAAPAVADLVTKLADSDPVLRAAAAKALGKIAHKSAVKPLAKAVHDQNDRVRQRAVVALGEIGPQSAVVAPSLIASMADQTTRSLAREALVKVGSRAADELVKSLSDQDVRFDAALALQRIDSARAKQAGVASPSIADLPSLSAVLLDETRTTESLQVAASSLAILGDGGFAVLIKAFGDSRIARTSAEAFAKADASAVPHLAKALRHPVPEVRLAAADAVGHMGLIAGGAVPGLTHLLKDQDRATRDVRYHAVRALHELGHHSAKAIPALGEVILNSAEQEPTRQWAIKTLIVTLPKTHDDVVKILINASGEKTNYGVRQLARSQLLKIDAKAAKAAGIK